MTPGEEFYKGVPDSWFKKKEYSPYEIEKFDRESIDEIRKHLKKKLYKDRGTVMDHLHYLEQLANKVQQAIISEKGEGEVTWELEHDLNDINSVFKEVEAVFEQNFSVK